MKSEIKDIHNHINYLMKNSMKIKENLTKNDEYYFHNTKLFNKFQKLKYKQNVS